MADSTAGGQDDARINGLMSVLGRKEAENATLREPLAQLSTRGQQEPAQPANSLPDLKEGARYHVVDGQLQEWESPADSGASRRLLENRGFELIVDGGLGAGPREYLAIRVHRFPSQLRADEVFADGSGRVSSDPLAALAYRAEIDRRVSMGESETEARCGLLQAAGATVAAAFVGAVAGSIVVGDVLREIHDGPRFALVDVDLASPNDVQLVPDTSNQVFGSLPRATPGSVHFFTALSHFAPSTRYPPSALLPNPEAAL